MKPSEAVPLDHPRDGDPEHCCAGGGHNFHFRPGAPKVPGHLISCCCKSLTTVIEAEEGESARELPEAVAEVISKHERWSSWSMPDLRDEEFIKDLAAAIDGEVERRLRQEDGSGG